MRPTEINAARHEWLDDIGFGLVLAPRAPQADPSVVTAEVYAEVLDEARTVADLVIVDTQILEAADTSGIVDRLVAPTLAAGGWAMCSSDVSSASVNNIYARLQSLRSRGMSRDRTMLVLNRVGVTASLNTELLGSTFSELATVVGTIPADDDFTDAFNSGRIPHDHPAFAAVLDDVLHRVTGLAVFDPSVHARGRERRGSLWSRFGRR